MEGPVVVSPFTRNRSKAANAFEKVVSRLGPEAKIDENRRLLGCAACVGPCLHVQDVRA